jgi:acyl-ACP thioesterase
MESNSNRLSKKFNIQSFEVDVNAKLTIPSICNFFQEVAWEHADVLHFGYNFLQSINKFWVLSRLHIKVHEYALWTEQIEITTWPKGIEGMFALRDFAINSIKEPGKRLISGTSSWLILDTEKHRPQRIDSMDHPKYNWNAEDAFIYQAEKLPAFENLKIADSFKVKYSDIDVNKHVNNVKYIQWAIDVLSEKLYNGSSAIEEIVVNFLSEAAIGDEITVSANSIDSVNLISIHDNTRNKETCRMKVLLKNN